MLDSNRLIAERLVAPQTHTAAPRRNARARALEQREIVREAARFGIDETMLKMSKLPHPPSTLSRWFTGSVECSTEWLAPQVGLTAEELDEIRLWKNPTPYQAERLSAFFADYGPKNIWLWIKRKHTKRRKVQSRTLLLKAASKNTELVLAIVPFRMAQKNRYAFFKLSGNVSIEDLMKRWAVDSVDEP